MKKALIVTVVAYASAAGFLRAPLIHALHRFSPVVSIARLQMASVIRHLSC
jgi:hypothetical protein